MRSFASSTRLSRRLHVIECSDEQNKNVSTSFLQKQNMETLIKRFKTDLHNCVGFIQDSKKMKDGIRELCAKYVQQSDLVSQGICLVLADAFFWLCNF